MILGIIAGEFAREIIAKMAAENSPKTPKSTFREKFDQWTSGKMKENYFDIIAELDSVRDTTKYADLTPTQNKSFLDFHPEDFNLEEGETRTYIDPKSLSGK